MLNLSCENEFYSMRVKSHFNINGLALSLALKQRFETTAKWPIGLAYTCSIKNIHAMFFSFTHYQFFTLSDRHFCAVNSLLKFVSRRPVSLFVLFSHRCSWTSRSRDRQVTGESSGIEYSCTAINWFKRPTAKKIFPKVT